MSHTLSMTFLIDNSAKTWPSAFHLSLNEKEKKYSDILLSWMLSFYVPFPPAILANGNMVTAEAITETFSRINGYFKHGFLHLLDMNVKKRVFPVLSSVGKGASSCVGFKKGSERFANFETCKY